MSELKNGTKAVNSVGIYYYYTTTIYYYYIAFIEALQQLSPLSLTIDVAHTLKKNKNSHTPLTPDLEAKITEIQIYQRFLIDTPTVSVWVKKNSVVRIIIFSSISISLPPNDRFL